MTTDSGYVHGGYFDTIATLVRMLETLNTADADEAATWLEPDDSHHAGPFGNVRDCLVAIAGFELYDHWCHTGEICFELASRVHLAT